MSGEDAIHEARRRAKAELDAMQKHDGPTFLERHADDVSVAASTVVAPTKPETCTIPPPGWVCTRGKHDGGPCAAWPSTLEGRRDFGDSYTLADAIACERDAARDEVSALTDKVADLQRVINDVWRRDLKAAEFERDTVRAQLKNALAELDAWKRRWDELSPKGPHIDDMLKVARIAAISIERDTAIAERDGLQIENARLATENERLTSDLQRYKEAWYPTSTRTQWTRGGPLRERENWRDCAMRLRDEQSLLKAENARLIEEFNAETRRADSWRAESLGHESAMRTQRDRANLAETRIDVQENVRLAAEVERLTALGEDMVVDIGQLQIAEADLKSEVEYAKTIRDAARAESQKHLDENRALRVKLGEASQAGVISSVNDAIGRAGIHCAISFAEAIDQIAKERDDARRDRRELKRVMERMQAEFDVVRPLFGISQRVRHGHYSVKSRLEKDDRTLFDEFNMCVERIEEHMEKNKGGH